MLIHFPAIMRVFWLSLVCFILVSCGQKETQLEGHRVDPRTDLDSLLIDKASSVKDAENKNKGQDRKHPAPAPDTFGTPDSVEAAKEITLSSAVTNKSWSLRGGNKAHYSPHLALAKSISLQWSTPIGAPNSRKTRITTAPVIENNLIYTMDGSFTIMAHSLDGAPIWERSILRDGEKSVDASTGVLSTDGTRVFATSGFGDIVALDGKSGEILWRQALGSLPIGAALPANNLLYVITAGGEAWALSPSDGRMIWTEKGFGANSVYLGAASPVATDRFVVFPYASGQLIAVLKNSGVIIWHTDLVGKRVGRAYSNLARFSGDPVFDGKTIFVGSTTGQFLAIDANNGQTKWAIKEGSIDTPWVAGGSVFMISDQSQLVRLDAKTGDIIWAKPLPSSQGSKRKGKGITAHYGPILAGGQLWVASSDAGLSVYDPQSGQPIASYHIPGNAASAPIVANQSLYILSADGHLHSFR